MVKKIKWSWKLRIKRNQKRIKGIEDRWFDLDDTVKQIIETQNAQREKISALGEKVNILEENNEILESNSVIMANKIKALEGIVKNGYKEETCVDGVEINYPSLIEINNRQKEQIEALEEKFNRTQVSFENLILRKSGREKHLENKIKALEEFKKSMDGLGDWELKTGNRINDIRDYSVKESSKIGALESNLREFVGIIWERLTGEIDYCEYEIKMEEIKNKLEANKNK